jgi:transcriptional regulator with XRE-family HTH domain
MKYKFINSTSLLGEYLKKLRKEKKLTLKELSKSSGVSYSQISKIESNVHKPTVETLIKLSNALSIDLDELLQYKESYVTVKSENEIDVDKKYSILIKYNRTCQMCGAKAPNVELNISYITPPEIGGENTNDNLIPLCKNCYTSRKSLIKENGIINDYIYNQYKNNKSS